MTRKRDDDHSTEFGLWTREQEELDSSKGYIATDIDWMWNNYNTGEWMYMEEKRNESTLKFAQWSQLKISHEACKDKNYQGFYLVTFENTNPDDGYVCVALIDFEKYKTFAGIILTNEEFLRFLQFDTAVHNKIKNWKKPEYKFINDII